MMNERISCFLRPHGSWPPGGFIGRLASSQVTQALLQEISKTTRTTTTEKHRDSSPARGHCHRGTRRDLAHAVGPESLSTRTCSRPWHLKQCISDPGPRTPKWASESQAQHGNPKSTRFLGNLANTRAPAFRDPQGDPHSATPDTKEKPLAAPAPRGCRIQTKREQ